MSNEPVDSMNQKAPWPAELAWLVQHMQYRPGWIFRLMPELDRGQGSEGLTLVVTSLGYDTYHPELGEQYRVMHYMPVPPASYNRESWQEWLLEQLLAIESHEACEFFQIDGKRPFAPNHGPGWNPYQVRMLNTPEAAETSFRGIRDEGSQA